MATRKNFDVEAVAGEIGSALFARGLVFEIEGDNRGGRAASRYLCVRKPFAAKIRVSNHRSNWVERNAQRSRLLMLDVGPHGITAAEAVATIDAHRASPPPQEEPR